MPVRVLGPDGKTYSFPDGTDKAAAVGYFKKNGIGTAKPTAKAPALPTVGQRIFGPNASASTALLNTDAAKNIGSHAVGAVTGPAHAAFDEPQNKPEAAASIYGPGALAAYRMLVEPTVNAVQEARKQYKEGNIGGKTDPYDAQGNYHPTVVSSAMDAIPLAGPWARNIETEAREKGLLPAVAGALTDTAVPEAVGKVAPGVLANAKDYPARAADYLKRAIAPEQVLSRPLPEEPTVTPRQRYNDAKDIGVNLDMAQATGATAPKALKRVTENLALGRGKFDDTQADNISALHAEADSMLDRAHPQDTSREDFGDYVKDLLAKHQQQGAEQANHTGAAQQVLDNITPDAMSREDFGRLAQQQLIQDQASKYRQSSDIFEDLGKRKGVAQPDLSSIRRQARELIADNKGYYDKHPELLKGATNQAWNILQSLAKGDEAPAPKTVTSSLVDASGRPITREVPQTAPVRDNWSDLHKLRSDLLSLTESPDIVGSRAEGWMKKMTGAVHADMTSEASGLAPADRAKFEQGNAMWAKMKDDYDNPQSPFFSILRSKEPLAVADTVNGLKPEAMAKLQQVAKDTNSPELATQAQRQAVSRILDPTGSGDFDLEKFPGRLAKMQTEKLQGVIGPDHLADLNELAKHVSGYDPYADPKSILYKVSNAADGTKAADILANPRSALTPADMRDLQQVSTDTGDQTLVPQLQRQFISRLLTPEGNEAADLKGLPQRVKNLDQERMNGVLTPEQVGDVDRLARTSRAVHADSNPSGSGRTAVAAAEGVGALEEGKHIVTGLAQGDPSALIAPVAYGTAVHGISKALTSPGLTDAVVNRQPMPPPVPSTPVDPSVSVPAGLAVENRQEKQDEPTEQDKVVVSADADKGIQQVKLPTLTPPPKPTVLTHPLGSVTGIDHDSGLPIVKRAAPEPATPAPTASLEAPADVSGPQASTEEPTPDTHYFDVAAWQKANPDGDPEEAKQVATDGNYSVQA